MIVSLLNYHYPFGEAPVASAEIIVEQILAFPNSKDLHEKKSQIIKKRELITNPSLIKILKVYSHDLQLHSIYEYVPYTLTSFLQMKLTTQSKDIWEMTKNLFLKKITYQLTILIAYLAKMKIQVELTPQNLGISNDEKLKLYISNRCKMGHKTEVRLISFYGKCKQKIRQFIEDYFQSIPEQPKTPINFKIKGNKLQFDQNISLDSSDLNFSKLSDNFRKSNLSGIRNKAKNKINSIRRKMSSGNFEFGAKSLNQPEQQSNFSVKEPRSHKYSFQCETPRMSNQTFNNFNSNTFQKDERQNEPKYSQSKHVKIQLEQKQNDNIDFNGQKQRKNSYKVKITTFRQYEVDNCDPQDLFKPQDCEKDDIFEYFANRAKKEEEEKEKEKEKEKQEHEQEHYQQQQQEQEKQHTPQPKLKSRKTTFQTQNTYPSPTQSFLVPPNYRSPYPSRQKQATKKQLQDKIKNVKERVQKVLSQIKRYKNSL